MRKMYNKKKKIFIVLVALAVICVCGYFLFEEDLLKDSVPVKEYSLFYNEVQSGELESVTIDGKWLYCVKKVTELGTNDLLGEEKALEYKTQNPDSPLLKEFLLQNGVSVKEKKGTDEIISIVLDVIFYGFFILVIVFAFRKFISPNTFKVVHNTGKTFKDVVGMEQLKKDMIQVMDVMQHPDEWAKKGVRMPKGIIMEGEPGNGKTLFAKALAGEANVNFIPAKATDFESMFMAIGPLKVKLLFKKARRRAPCIVFIDEFDGIGTRRNYTGSAIETENTRIVTALLNELDGFENTRGVLVLAATNSISALDEALIRPGRFDARVKVPFPDEKSRVELVKMYLNCKLTNDSLTPELLARKFNGYSCAKIESVLNRAGLIAGQNERSVIDLSDIENAIREFSNAR